MLDETTKEVSQAGKMKEEVKRFVNKHLGTTARKAALAVALGTAAGTGIGLAVTEQPQSDKLAEVAPVSTVLNFTDYFSLSREEQEKLILSLKDKNVALNVNTNLLKLHHKLDGNGYKLLDLNTDLVNPQPSFSKNWNGHPVEVRVSDGQYEKLKSIWPIDQFADMTVPEGTKLLFQATQLPRGSDPKEVTTQLAFITFTPSQK